MSSPETDSPDDAPALRIHGISKRFAGLQANDNVSLELQRGEVLALLGENGAGKTTLMNILFGHYVADAGWIEVNGQALRPGSPAAAIGAGIGMVHQHFTLADNLTVLDNVMLGTESLWKPFQAHRAARQRLEFLAEHFGLEVAPDAQIGSLSVGERQRVEILKALYRDARILILDEPTAVLTPQETERLFKTLRDMVAEGLSVIFISHKLQEVLDLADRIVVLRDGKIAGQFDAINSDRATLAKTMVGSEIAQPKRHTVEPGSAVLTLSSVSLRRGRSRLADVTLSVHAGEILGVAGVSGNGQVRLAEILCGLRPPDSGRVTLLGQEIRRGGPARMVAAGVGRIPEDRQRSAIIGDFKVYENLILEAYREPRFSRLGWFKGRAILQYAWELIHRYDVRCAGTAVKARTLSGGNLQKLVLARVLSREPKLVVACQPTQGLDVGAAAYVHEQLLGARDRGGAIILISEDLEELMGLSDRVAVMFRGRLSEPIPRQQADLGHIGLLMSGHGDQVAAHAT